jgi:tricorn protease
MTMDFHRRFEEAMMNRFSRTCLAVAAIFLFAAPVLQAVNVKDTLLLSQPAIGPDRIAFVYANDLWTAAHDGSDVRRLTTDIGVESNPMFSPDGSLIAFNGQYDGNTDVFVVPAGGGVPVRLTWHPGADIVQGFTPDGKAVLFTSTRISENRAYGRLFSVPVSGGPVEMLEIPYIARAAMSPDGGHIAYNPFGDNFLQWKNYRGGTFSRIWIFKRSDHSIIRVPQPEGRSNDAGPMWLGGKVYFRSDRNGEFNIYSFDPATGEVRQRTFFDDFPVLYASAGAGKIVFEQAGALHMLDIDNDAIRRLTIGVAADLPEVRERFAKGGRWIRNAAVSPSGARAVFEFRGEIVTVPAEKGDPRNLTRTPAVHERSPVWSPDGRSIAYFTDASGEYELCVRSQDGKDKGRSYKLGGSGYYGSPAWSPDGKKIVFADNSLSLYWIDLATGAVKKIGSEYLYQPGGQARLHSSWSPDSKWIACTFSTPTYFRQVFVYSLDQDELFPLTDGLSDVSEPVFDPSGKHLYFFGSTDAGPVLQWFDMSNVDMRATQSLYLAVLRNDLPNPLAKESDEEKGVSPQDPKAKPEKKDDAPAAVPVRIDFDGFDRRIVAVPVQPGVFRNLQAGNDGKIYFLEAAPPLNPGVPGSRETSLRVYDLAARKDEVLASNIDAFMLTGDRKKMLAVSRGTWSILPAAGKPEPGKGKLDTEAIEVRVDPRAEWRQMFDEAWRINRDYFYDPGFHGADWTAMKEKYAVFLPHLSCRGDLNRVIQWMCSELAAGHHRVGGGDVPGQPTRVPGGLLGADFEIADGRYRFKKVYGGLNWNPELRSPLTEPGVDVKDGEYLLAVAGRDLTPPDNLYARFENTSGKIVEITVGPNPGGKGSRVVQVVPIDDEFALRNRDWVESNIRKVHEATDGRVAYVYVPNTTTLGHIYFKRYFFPQADKDAIIVDERFNGGGSVADYYIDWLRKPVISYWAMRYGADLKTPSASIQGPKVMLINESAGSGGDLLPYMFRKFGMGKLVGTATWGGLVGTLGFPVLMDGGMVTAPNLAFWDEGEGFGIENVGVPPDIEIEQTPADVIAGRDPQLEKAIALMREELEKNPPVKPKRPPFPIRVRR